MKILVTGAAGFIGFHLCIKLLNKGFEVVGLDNINKYYDIDLKYDRLAELGIKRGAAQKFQEFVQSKKYKNFKFIRMNLEDRESLPGLFEEEKFEKVYNLAAQVGVRYSLENPTAYIDSNIVGFSNLLECCRNYDIQHLIFASSSSVYGQNKKVPFAENDVVDHPISLYAATKKSNELMAYTYSHLYGFKTTGLRFFTVYGPWGRPDMAMFLFVKAIMEGKEIKTFNRGKLSRDFTYIDDIVEGVYKAGEKDSVNDEKYKIYNIGNGNPVKLLDFISEIEKQLNIPAKKKMMPMQPGDVFETWADCTNLKNDLDYNPNTSISEGISKFLTWFKSYYY
ncbi:UDP-glucuronate 4-epimerase [Salegentibacter echinorum]|uniref:UDP-glucuronate 4-epimerase n=1 Tax=Salegentibacter echinorum TaxID=1073325 RepID=A0A1M5FGP4_SALEC|nr:NAD-dependent epimerase [Salegentibacter echinorum]SHF90648.1 UDP-glucuronate 4-epimerase [Salegentibacter echinorum]